jgi:cell filamentation protein
MRKLANAESPLCNRRRDLSTVARDEWYAAWRDSMPFRRDGQANHRTFLPLLVRALG